MFEFPAAQNFGKQIFWELNKNNSTDNGETTSSQGSSNASQHAVREKEKESESRRTKSLSDLKLGSSQMRKRLKPILDAVKDYASTMILR